jgi:hypothetical protein
MTEFVDYNPENEVMAALSARAQELDVLISANMNERDAVNAQIKAIWVRRTAQLPNFFEQQQTAVEPVQSETVSTTQVER